MVFDKDGTLEDSASFLRELGIKVAQLVDQQIPGLGEPLLISLGIVDNHLNVAGLMAVGTRLENEIATAAYIAQTGKSWIDCRIIAAQLFQASEAQQLDSSVIFPGVKEVIRYLHQAGLKIAILSSDTTANIADFIEQHQLSAFIEVFQGGDQGYNKPNPACFQQVCQKLAVAPQNALMVGDSQMDIQMALKAQAGGVVGIFWGGDPSPHTLAGADVAIARLWEIQLGC